MYYFYISIQNIFFKFYLFPERVERRERGWETSMRGCLLPPTGGEGCLAHSPGMLPGQESNQRPLGSQAGAQSTEPHQPGLNTEIFMYAKCINTVSSTNNTPFLLQSLLLQNHKQVILYCDNMTLKHTIWRFRWNVQIITITSYAHIIILPTTLKQALFLRDPLSPPFNSRPSGVPFKLLSLTSRSAALQYHRELDITITTEGQAHVLHSWASHYRWHMPRTLSPMHLGSFLINVGYTFHSICDNFKNYEEWLGWNVYNMM